MFFKKPDLSNRTREGLTFRDITLSDVPRIAELAGDWDIASMTGRIPYPYSENAALQWVEDLSPGEFVRAIVNDGEFIGICGALPSEEDPETAEIGYWIGKPYWGAGHATSATHMLKDLAFKQLGLKRLTAGHFADNPASGRVLEKLGFQLIGPTRCWSEARRGEVDALCYELHQPKPWWQRDR